MTSPFITYHNITLNSISCILPHLHQKINQEILSECLFTCSFLDDNSPSDAVTFPLSLLSLLNIIQNLFSSESWKVYDQQPHDQMPLLDELNGGFPDIWVACALLSQ